MSGTGGRGLFGDAVLPREGSLFGVVYRPVALRGLSSGGDAMKAEEKGDTDIAVTELEWARYWRRS